MSVIKVSCALIYIYYYLNHILYDGWSTAHHVLKEILSGYKQLLNQQRPFFIGRRVTGDMLQLGGTASGRDRPETLHYWVPYPK